MYFRIFIFFIVIHCSVRGYCDDCKGCGGDPNAHPGCGLNCGHTCADYKDPPCDCDERIGCIEHGCDCNDGYVKDPNVGKCVKPEDCTPTCKDNEVFNSCGKPCQPSCDVRRPNCTGTCIADCFCAPGYIRQEDHGPCIKLGECKSCNGDPHSRPGCGNPCGHTCADVGKPPHPCPLFCLADGCDCIEGYVLDTNIHKCVKPSDCTPACRANETYSLHPVICPPQDCDAIGETFGCVSEIFSDKPACVCQIGYYRNRTRRCVLVSDCDSCGSDRNARPGCPCYQTCADVHAGKSPHLCLECPIDPDTTCNCIEGLVMDQNIGRCVKPSDCTPTCKEHEVYSECGPACDPHCYDRSPNCTYECVAMCFCADGYIRKEKDGPCIKIGDCESCNGDPKARPGFGNTCGHTCADVGRPPPKCPRDFSRRLVCDCVKGYVLDTTINKCVKPSKCSAPVCSVNETYSQIAVICPPETCDAISETFHCPSENFSGTPICVCKKGYYRNKAEHCVLVSNCDSCGSDRNARPGCPCYQTCADVHAGKSQHTCLECPIDPDTTCNCIEGLVMDQNIRKCVKPDKCTPTCKEHEVYALCGPACDPHCYDRSPNCTHKCVSMCFCADGYIRKEKDGPCIKISDCESCNGDTNARPGCGNSCGHTCADVGKPPPKCPLNPRCSHGCDCVKGYVLDNNIKKCVKPSECSAHQCPLNETYSQHPVICPPDTCAAIGGIFHCPINSTSNTPACVCKPGYFRNKDKDCVLNNNCDSCNGDTNGRPGCPCLQTCFGSYNPDYPTCLRPIGAHSCPACHTDANSCTCIEGYLLDQNINKCVKPCDCTKPCKWNEVYKSCGTACQPYCDNHQPKCTEECVEGCFCATGFIRKDKHGPCIKLGQCTSRCPVNETYSQHPVICPPDTCAAIGGIFHCPFNSTSNTPACVCKPGYYRNKDKDCVLYDDCDSCNGDSNGRPGCPCDQTCSASYDPDVPSCLIHHGPHSCPNCLTDANSCTCIEGYLLDQNINKCVKPCDCTPHCKVNEVFKSCGTACQPYCDDRRPKCTEECVAGCFCDTGYIRKDKHGPCIKLKNCDSCDGDSNARPGCGDPCCRTCADCDESCDLSASDDCDDKCHCAEGYCLDADTEKCDPACPCPCS